MKNPKRIVIVGASGVGKTSLINELTNKSTNKSKFNLDLQIIEEQARIICRELGYKSIYEIKEPNKFREQVLRYQIQAEEKLNEFISDRSTIDCWAHWLRWSMQRAMVDQSVNYYNQALNQALKYSHIIYIPKMFKTKKDNFRWANDNYQMQMDRLVKSILTDWGLMKRTYIVESKILKERKKEVLEYLNNS